MSEQKFVKGMIIGAVAGGLITLIDKNTRDNVCMRPKGTGGRANYYIQHPSEAVHEVRECYDKMASDLSKGADEALGTLSQVQATLEKVSEISNESSATQPNITITDEHKSQ